MLKIDLNAGWRKIQITWSRLMRKSKYVFDFVVEVAVGNTLRKILGFDFRKKDISRPSLPNAIRWDGAFAQDDWYVKRGWVKTRFKKEKNLFGVSSSVKSSNLEKKTVFR